MLNSERYNQALSALSTLGEFDQLTRQTLLDEEWRTQLALNALGVTQESPVSKIPGINQIVNPSYIARAEKPGDIFIEVAGMPKAMKTSLIRKAAQRLPLIRIKEAAREIKGQIKEADWSDLPGLGGYYAIYESFKHSRLAEFYLKMEERNRPKIIDRGILDCLPFLRSHFLLGRIKREPFTTINDFFRIPLSFNNSQLNNKHALVICLIAPKLSLEREGQRETPGDVMNLSFLSTLSEQYLRLYHELLSQPASFPFVCVDMSGSFDQNWRIFSQTLQTIISSFIP